MTGQLASKQWTAPSKPFVAQARRNQSESCLPRLSVDQREQPAQQTRSGRLLSRFRLVIAASIGVGLGVSIIAAYFSFAAEAPSIHNMITVRALSLLAALAFVGVWDRIVRVMKG